MILIYVPCKDEEQAKTIGKTLLEKRLIACANIFPISSMYWWQGKIEDGSEAVLLCKTKTQMYDDVARVVKDLHSYETPCIMKIEVDANKEYVEWAEQELSNQ
ncbi:divalent-cation tolerance protein CutA [Thermoproteota archaeon]